MNEEIVALRKHLNQTQQQFAETLHVSIATVRTWEQGKYHPSPAAMEKIGVLVKKLKREQKKQDAIQD
jgi:DNA-binding transcriptional regulator YiaG